MHERSDGSGDPGRTSGPAANHAAVAGLGLTMGLATMLFAWGGNWLDGRLDTSPLFVLLGAFLGFGGGFWTMYSRLVLRSGRAPEQDAEREE